MTLEQNANRESRAAIDRDAGNNTRMIAILIKAMGRITLTIQPRA
jgi:hypothetical protein